MANIQGTYLAFRNWVEESGVTFTTDAEEVGTRVASNVATTQSDDFWRVGGLSVGSDSAYLIIDFTVDRSVGAVSVQFPRGVYPGVSETEPAYGPSDTLRFRLLDAADSTLWDSGVNASGVVAGYMIVTARPNAAVTARKLRIDFAAPSRADATFFDVSNVGAWSILDPAIGFAYPAGFGWTANTQNIKTPAGRVYTQRFEPFRRWSLAFDTLSNSDSLEFDELVRYTGGARQSLVRRGDLPVGKDAMLCLIASLREIESLTPSVRQFTATFEEFI